MDHLTDAQIDTLHNQLIVLEKTLIASLDATEDGARPVDLDQPIGRLSRIDAIQQQKMVKANRQRARIRRSQVKAALKSIEAGTYGVCNKCSDEISLKRLEVRPESPLCIECQGEQEGGTRKRRRRR